MEQQDIIAAFEARTKKLGVSMREVCLAAGVHPTTFSRWKKSGKRGRAASVAGLDKISSLDKELAKREAQ